MTKSNLPVHVQTALENYTDKQLISVTDAKGRIVYVSDSFAKLTKYTEDELLGENHRILKSGDVPAEIFDELWYSISHDSIWKGILKNKAKDGTIFSVKTTIIPITGKSPRDTFHVSIRTLV